MFVIIRPSLHFIGGEMEDSLRSRIANIAIVALNFKELVGIDRLNRLDKPIPSALLAEIEAFSVALIHSEVSYRLSKLVEQWDDYKRAMEKPKGFVSFFRMFLTHHSGWPLVDCNGPCHELNEYIHRTDAYPARVKDFLDMKSKYYSKTDIEDLRKALSIALSCVSIMSSPTDLDEDLSY